MDAGADASAPPHDGDASSQVTDAGHGHAGHDSGASRDDAGGGGPPPGTPGVGTGAAISPFLFAQNYWNEPDIAQLWPVVQESGVQLIRYGGIYANQQSVPNREKYADVTRQIRAIGAEPYLQISRTFSADTARDVVDYINNQQHLNVTYWCIGNEPNLTAYGGPVSAGDAAAYIKSLASAMRDADPDIVIFAPELAWYDEGYLLPMLGGDLDITGQDASGRYYIDGVTFHFYPFGNAYDRGQVLGAHDGLRGNVQKLMVLLEAANQKHGRTGEHKLRWGLTEFNISYQNPGNNGVDDVGVHSFLNGQFFAEVFAVGMEFGALTAATWSVHESDGARGEADLGYLDGPVGATVPRSSYYHLQMLAQRVRGHHAPVSSSDGQVRVVASGDGERVVVAVLNHDPAASRKYRLNLDGQAPDGSDVSLSVSAGVPVTHEDQIGAQTSEVLTFSASGELLERVHYDIGQARNTEPPTVTTP